MHHAYAKTTPDFSHANKTDNIVEDLDRRKRNRTSSYCLRYDRMQKWNFDLQFIYNCPQLEIHLH